MMISRTTVPSCVEELGELQQLVLPALPEHVATLGPEFWDAAWRDLAELVEQGSLSCCSSPNEQSEKQRGASVSKSGESPVAQPHTPSLP